jgi:hypothetical protein
MADSKVKDPAETTGISLKNVQPEVNTDDKSANLGPANPAEVRRLAEALPEKDAVQKAYKDALTTEDPQAEARAYLKVAEESPDAMGTPSGYALKASAGESNDTARGEKYERAKQEKRWGWAPVD